MCQVHDTGRSRHHYTQEWVFGKRSSGDLQLVTAPRPRAGTVRLEENGSRGTLSASKIRTLIGGRPGFIIGYMNK